MKTRQIRIQLLVYIDLGGHNYGPITLTVTTSGYHKDPGWDIKVRFLFLQHIFIDIVKQQNMT